MNFSVGVHSLYYKSCVAVLSALWNDPHICKNINAILLEEIKEEAFLKHWVEMEKNILLRIESNICLPEVVKFRLKNLIQPVGYGIMYWMGTVSPLFREYGDLAMNLSFVWSSSGVLDIHKTAEVIIRCNPTYPLLCFCLACKFCMQDILLEHESSEFFAISRKLAKSEIISRDSIVQFWIHSLSSKWNSGSSIADELNALHFREVVKFYEEPRNVYGYVPLLRYFVERVSIDQSYRILHDILESLSEEQNPMDGCVLIYLLSHCEKSYVNSYVHNFPYTVLSCFLEWHCLELFLPTINRLWDYLEPDSHQDLIVKFAELISLYHMTCDYQTTFYEFWKCSPPRFKKCIYSICRECRSQTFMKEFCYLKKSHVILKVILNDSPPEIRKQIIFNYGSMDICDFFAKEKRWDSLKMFVTICITSVEVLNEFLILYKSYHHNVMRLRTFAFCQTVKNLVLTKSLK